MARRIKLVLIIAVSNLILSAYYLFVGLRLSALYSQFNVEKPSPIFGNKYFLFFLIYTLFSFIYWYSLRRRVKKSLEVNLKIHNLIVLFLASPIIYLAVLEIYTLIVLYVIIPLTI